MIKLFKPYISWWSIWNVIKVLRGTQLAEGPLVKKFEKDFAEKFNLSNVLALNSGTAALELAYEVAGLSKDDEVISPILTCTATNIPLVRRGVKIVFADIDFDLNISIEDVKKKITPKTKAIVFVHFGGNNRGLEELLEIVKEKNIILIEDAAQAVGSDFWGKGDFTCVSLQAIKALTSGDGGMLSCKNIEHYKKAKRLRWFGYDRDEKQKKGDTDLLEAGYKYHMNDVTAAIGLGNMKVVDKIISHRKKIVDAYKSYGIGAYPWFAFVKTSRRKELISYLKENGVESGMHHYRNDQYTIFGGRKVFVNMDALENDYLLLPVHMDVSVSDVNKIVRLLRKFDDLY